MKNKITKKNNESCDVIINFVAIEEEKENECIKKIARLFDRFLDEESRNQKQSEHQFKESLEDVLGI